MKKRELLLRFTTAGTVNPMLGHVHRAAQSDPHVTRSGTGSQRISRGCPETVEDYIANESPPEIAELALNREGEFRMLHPLSVSALGGGGGVTRERLTRRPPTASRARDRERSASRC